MRSQGKIRHWKDEQGFGFIIPDGGGTDVFVHVKAFINRSRRPHANENVTYELETDREGRLRATRVLFEKERLPGGLAVGKGMLASTVAAFVFIGLAGVTLAGKLPTVLPAIYFAASVVTFATYAKDKSAAKNDRWRTPENTLHLLGLVGGWPGGLLAQSLLRHKSSKRSFQYTFWVTVVLNTGALVWLLTPQGSGFLHTQLIDSLWLR
jgi:uncharacterized membrane protein YsdA (DUF1294 family)/cold shock CspA family protein